MPINPQALHRFVECPLRANTGPPHNDAIDPTETSPAEFAVTHNGAAHRMVW
jgi:hypothetical protein